MDFASILNQAMSDAQITNYRLAKELSVHPSTVASWRAGTTAPKYDTILKIEDILKIALVMHDEDDPVSFNRNASEMELLSVFNKLNVNGQSVALERIKELSEISKYTK